MPDEFAFTIRVNGATDPALAHALWTLPWGSRNRMALELMALGLASKQSGGTLAHPLLSHPLPRSQPQRKPTRAKRAANVGGVQAPAAAATAPIQHTQALPPPEHPPAVPPSPGRSPAVQSTLPPTAPHAASAPTMTPPPAAPPTPPPDPTTAESPPPSSGLSLLLGQFDDD